MTQAEIAKAGVELIPKIETRIAIHNFPQDYTLIAALRLLEPVASGEKVIVPKEPTEKMILDGYTALEYNDLHGIYCLMIAAAQEETP